MGAHRSSCLRLEPRAAESARGQRWDPAHLAQMGSSSLETEARAVTRGGEMLSPSPPYSTAGMSGQGPSQLLRTYLVGFLLLGLLAPGTSSSPSPAMLSVPSAGDPLPCGQESAPGQRRAHPKRKPFFACGLLLFSQEREQRYF